MTVLNKELKTLKTFDGTLQEVRSLVGNNKFIAYGIVDGKVMYYDLNGDTTPKVGETSNF